MRLFSSFSRLALLLVCSAFGLSLSTTALAQSQGFQLSRYQPTAAGEWSFLVSHPWYSSTRYFAVGLSFNYAHDPLVYTIVRSGGTISERQAIIEHQLTGHLDLAGSFLDRVLLTASLPVTLLERGQPVMGSSLAPADNPYLSDPRFGAMVRLFGQPYGSAASMSLGGQVWVPLAKFTQSFPEQASDSQVRGRVELTLGGLSHHILWSTDAGFLIRPEARLGAVTDPAGRTATHEFQFGFALAYADLDRRFAIGPEVLLATVMNSQIFTRLSTSLEVLGGIHYNIASVLQLSAAGGLGVLGLAGTPDARALFRLAYAPMGKPKPKDRDHDGVLDMYDMCPDEPRGENPDPLKRGCPQRDRDGDGVFDGTDECPEQPAGAHPDPVRLGCPASDRDGDGLFDYEDQCPDVPKGEHPDPQKPGCPAGDKDGDGVLDYEDQCPETPKGDHPDSARLGCPVGDKDNDGVIDSEDVCVDQPKGDHPDPQRLGCPASDRDNDGVFDFEDRCIDVPAGPTPDPTMRGCPAADRDHDMVPDMSDACPDKPGVPSPDPKKNGCPNQYVILTTGKIVMKQEIFFDFNKASIKPQSFPLLQALADVLSLTPQIKRVRVEGHTDNTGVPVYNLDLSQRRARSVMDWLVEHGIDQSRLESEGYGDTRPIADNQTIAGRAKNRRVVFVILDPASDPNLTP